MPQTINIQNKLTNIDLSIQLSLNGLSFCILHKESNTICVLKRFLFEDKVTPTKLLEKLKDLFHTEIFLQKKFDTVSLIHDNNLSAFVPKPLFNKDCLTDYLKFNCKILKSDLIVYDNLSINDIVNVYVPYVNINNFIYDKFGAFNFKHVSTLLIEQILKIEKHSEIPKVYANIEKESFEIIVVKNTKLIFYNTFEYNTKEDFIYYLLFTTECLKLNPETLNLIFTGEIDSKDELYLIAFKYIRFVFLGNREDHYKYDLNAQPNSNHSNFAIINSF